MNKGAGSYFHPGRRYTDSKLLENLYQSLTIKQVMKSILFYYF